MKPFSVTVEDDVKDAILAFAQIEKRSLDRMAAICLEIGVRMMQITKAKRAVELQKGEKE